MKQVTIILTLDCRDDINESDVNFITEFVEMYVCSDFGPDGWREWSKVSGLPEEADRAPLTAESHVVARGAIHDPLPTNYLLGSDVVLACVERQREHFIQEQHAIREAIRAQSLH